LLDVAETKIKHSSVFREARPHLLSIKTLFFLVVIIVAVIPMAGSSISGLHKLSIEHAGNLTPPPAIAESNASTVHSKILAQSAGDPFLQMGYGPNSLSFVTDDVPIYTLGDQMWLMSNYSQAQTLQIFLIVPSSGTSGTVLAQGSIDKDAATLFYTFGDSSLPTGVLTLTAMDGNNQIFSTNVSFVNPLTSLVNSLVTEYSVAAGRLDISFNFSLANRFNVQECLSNQSSTPASEAIVKVPRSAGIGIIGLSLGSNSGTADIDLSQVIGGAFDFYFQLFTNYSYSIVGSPGIFTKQLTAAHTDPLFVQGRRAPQFSLNVPLIEDTALRSGRYTLRAYFDNGSGIEGVSTRIVIPQISPTQWVWLGACQAQSISSTPFVASADLTATPPSGWPRYLYLMYQAGIGGMDIFKNVSLDLQISEINFQAFPWNVSLPSYIGVSLSSNSPSAPSIEDVDVSNGVAYVISTQFPANASFDMSFGGDKFETVQATLLSSYASAVANVKLSGISVQVSSGSSIVQGAKVTVSNNAMSNASATLFTNNLGLAQFYVPPGTYSVRASNLGNVSSGSLFVSPEANPSYSVNFPVASPPPSETSLLIVAAVVTSIGVAGNIWVWIIRRRRAISRL
jgi:hypothetical protein